MPRATLPDVLVLAAGGILGDAWMSGVLAGMEDASDLDFRDVEMLIGTSAGSIVAARLAGGERPRRPDGGDGAAEALAATAPQARGRGELVRDAARLAAAPFAPAALALGAPGGAFVRGAVLRRIPDGKRSLAPLRREIAALGLRFDGRLRVCCVERRTGRRVIFGAPGAPEADVADAVVASCSIPSVFRPVTIGDRRYVDGGAWSLTNLDAAPAFTGTEVLCLHPAASLGVAMGSAWGAVRAAAAAGAELEALALRRRGARVRIIGPDRDAAEHMGTNFMDTRPARAVLAAGFRQGRALAGRED